MISINQRTKALLNMRPVIQKWMYLAMNNDYLVVKVRSGYMCACGGTSLRRKKKHECSHIRHIMLGHGLEYEEWQTRMMLEKLDEPYIMYSTVTGRITMRTPNIQHYYGIPIKKKYGFTCLVVWESDWKTALDVELERIKEFLKCGTLSA
jgi:predicted nucleic acid-binding Zn finger protein